MKKKTLFLAMAVMVAAMLPIGSSMAQTKRIELSVKTLDHARITSAKIYAGTSGTNYYIDADHLHASYAGTAVLISTLTNPRDLVPATDGFSIQGDADSTTFGMAFIVVTDSLGRYYMLGDLSDLDSGIVRPAALFNNVSDTLRAALTAPGNMPMYSAAPLYDNSGWLYTSLAAVAANPNAASLNFSGDVAVDEPMVLNRSLTVAQNGHTLTNNCTGDLVVINNGHSLTWAGGNGIIVTPGTTSGSIIKANSAIVMLGATSMTSAASVVSLEGQSYLMITDGTYATTSPSNAVVMIKDSSLANIEASATISDGMYAVSMASNCTGRLDIAQQLASNLAASYATPINAYGYVNDNGMLVRSYYRSINQAAHYGDTVYLGRKMESPVTDSVANATVLVLGTDSIMSSLKVMHQSGEVKIMGGVTNDIVCDNASGTLTLEGIDSVGSLNPGSHPTTIVSGRYHNISTSSSTTMSIMGGKFEQEYTNYIDTNHTFMPNLEADSASFHYKVVPGHKVRYVNYDYKGNDTLIAYNNADRKISPRLSSPRYTDTIFIEWFKDSTFTQPWQFLDEELTKDTTLYAQWQVRGAGQHVYTVYHRLVSLDGTDTTIADSVIHAATADDTIVEVKRSYLGRETATDTIRFTMPDNDTVVNFYYTLRKFALTWNAGAGHFSDGTSVKVDSLKYTQRITLPEEPVLAGHTFVKWGSFPIDSNMISRDLTVNAIYDVTISQLTWAGDTTAAYTAEPINILSATYKDSDSNDVQAVLTYYLDTVADTAALKVGTYRVVATPQTSDYTLDPTNNTKTFVVTRAIVSVDITTIEFDSVKFYNGSPIAAVGNIGTLTGVLGSDLLTHNTTARYSDAEVGTGKPIVAYFSIDGQDTANYQLDTNAALLTANGVILDSIKLDLDTADNGIAVNVQGYCSGSDTIFYFIESGTPDEYNLIFSDDAVANQHFVNNGWTAVTGNYILIDIPVEANMGSYPVQLVFRNSAYPDMTSTPQTFNINVNMPKTYTMPLFDDVIALVDTCQCFSNIQWYRDGVAIEGATGYYYQEEGGLAGHTYHVTATMNGQATASCEQDDVTTLLHDDAAETAVTVSVYPNPTTQSVCVSINNSNAATHTLRVMNIMGVTVEAGSFNGDNTTIDMSRMINGSYTVSVDGVVVRVIKK